MKALGIDVFTGTPVSIDTADGIVAGVRQAVIREELPFIAPGFFDIQVNGFRGCDYGAEDFRGEDLHRIIADLAAAGVTRHMPTIVTAPRERTTRNLAIIASALGTSPEARAAITGIHLEGPYISSLDGPRGAHDPAFTRDPQWEELTAWQEAARGMIRLVTLAPERPGALDLIRKAVAGGIRVAIGHTAAEASVIAEAVRAGASLSTHLGNGCHGMIPRHRNYIWEQLACDELDASIITDGFHLPPAVIRSFWRVKGPGRIILTSDVAVMGGKPRGVYRWGGIQVEVFADGHLGLLGTDTLAGAAHMLDWDIPHCIAATGCTLGEAIRACTANPCRHFGLPENFARLEPGAPAHFVLFRWMPGQERLSIETTVIDGRTAYSAVR
jgi:N-acetylglucosamine-6-phosphate deacetylase